MSQPRYLIELGNELKQARIAKRYTQEDAARRLGISRGAIANYERGIRSIEIELFGRMCEIYGIDPAEIFNRIKKYLYK